MRAYIGTKIIMAEPQKKEGKEGYKVVYKDGYTSWSPKDVFEEAYHVTNNMTFGEALEALKKDRRVSREGWNGKGMYLFLAHGEDIQSCTGINEKCVDVICMKTAQDTVVFGWLASQTDMLAEDWVIVE
ncbi:MAG: DUF2829 domain-containing protein [Lachnospiraceae bacterium]|nr:DUF2829 domain-containing protein [Lachnospiraceae bacterium]